MIKAKKFHLGSVHKLSHLKEAARLASSGVPIGFYNRGVFALWGDAKNTSFVESVEKIKGEARKGKPLGATLSAKQLVEHLDKELIPAKFHHIFLNPQELSDRLGSLCFYRLLLTRQSLEKIPSSLISWNKDVPTIQNWDPSGHKPAGNLMQEFLAQGIDFPGITSLNLSDQPEIVTDEEAKVFAMERGIPLLLLDEKDPRTAQGSYPILEFNGDSISLVRQGHISHELLSHILSVTIDATNAKLAKYPQTAISFDEMEKMTPSIIRTKILARLYV